MSDGFKPNIPQDSEEFENLEKAQATQTQTAQQSQQQRQPKPQEAFSVKDEVGQAIETASQSVFGPTDPIQIQKQQMDQAKKKQEDAKKLANVKQFLNQMAADEQRQRELKQEGQQKKQDEQQVDQEKEQVEQMKKQDKEQSFQQQHIQAEQTKAERKLGVGG